MARKQILIPGGLRKSVNIPDAQTAGTVIAGYGGQTLTLAQLQKLLGVTAALPNTQVPTGGSTTIINNNAARKQAQAAGMFVSGGDDDGGGGSGPPGRRGKDGAAGSMGPAGPAGTPGGPRGFPIALVTEPAEPPTPILVRGPRGLVGATGAQGPAGRTKIWLPEEAPEPTMFVGRAKAGTASATAVTLAAAILADTPFAFWKCDDASTSLADSSGNGFNLTTVLGAPTYNASPLIPSLPATQFVNISGYATTLAAVGFALASSLGRSLPFTTWTMECIVAGFAGASGTGRIIDWRVSGASGILAIYWTGGVLTCFLNNTNTPLSQVSAPPGKPLHIVVTCSTSAGTSTLTPYINGIKIGSTTASASTASGGTPTIGVGDYSLGGTTSGETVGYIALFPTALSAARVAAHAAAAGLLAA